MTTSKITFKEAPPIINISEIVAKTEAMFDLLNEHFYQNELIRPAITVSSDNGRGAYGWCSIYVQHGFVCQGIRDRAVEIGKRKTIALLHIHRADTKEL